MAIFESPTENVLISGAAAIAILENAGGGDPLIVGPGRSLIANALATTLRATHGFSNDLDGLLSHLGVANLTGRPGS